MAVVIYLDVEDEITSAAARIRTARESRVALVLPYGSRLATSRINFRLLSREATLNGRRLDIVAPDASARALAASAGLSVFGSVREWEAAVEAGDRPDAAPASAEGMGAAAGAASAAGSTAATAPASAEGMGAAAGAASAAGSTAAVDLGGSSPVVVKGPAPVDPSPAPTENFRPVSDPPVVRSRAGGSRVRPVALASIGLLLVSLLAAGIAAWLLLPSAEIAIAPRLETIGPIRLEVRADPDATEVDAEAGVIPATEIRIPARASGEFSATGVRVDQTAATGSVTFESINTVGPVAVASGTRVATLDGVVFVTTDRVVVPPAEVAGDRIERGRVNAPVRADRSGPGGNVPAGAITQVPAALQAQQISVGNSAATTGGRRTEIPTVVQADVDAALAQLTTELEEQFTAALVDPVGVPAGSTVFPDTAVLGESRTDADPATLVGREVASFSLQMAADGTVLAADEAPLQAIAESRLEGSVAEGHVLVEGSSVVEVGEATVVDGGITFPVTGYAQQYEPLDAAALVALVLGLPLEEAEAVLEPFGEARIVLWPDWVTAVPTLEQRVIVVIGDPVGEPLPTATPAPTASPSAEPSEDVPGGEPVPSP